MNTKRIRTLQEGAAKKGPVLYWMSRDQRAFDNWALVFAQEEAIKKKEALLVVFCLVPEFLDAASRQYVFMLEGLRTIQGTLSEKDIPFCLLRGSPQIEIPKFIATHTVGTLITDFDPLKIKRRWKKATMGKIQIPLYEVDAHNIVPCWCASSKQEFAARTFRPKITKLLAEFLDAYPPLLRHPFPWQEKSSSPQWSEIEGPLGPGQGTSSEEWIIPGEHAARAALKHFIARGLAVYDETRNNPTKAGQSGLSPFLHFGHLSAQRTVLEIKKSPLAESTKAPFLEELVVRRELSDNFCYYNDRYDSVEGFPDWAIKTLRNHREDRRPYAYSLSQLEGAGTHDELWNAAQMEMVKKGKMHGYMRMYWAKKILEWTGSPEEAFEIALYLNNRYELDGRDPNGYAGCAWSIGGVHDRAWFERPLFGKIRYMSYNGCKSKFNVNDYIRQIKDL